MPSPKTNFTVSSMPSAPVAMPRSLRPLRDALMRALVFLPRAHVGGWRRRGPSRSARARGLPRTPGRQRTVRPFAGSTMPNSRSLTAPADAGEVDERRAPGNEDGIQPVLRHELARPLQPRAALLVADGPRLRRQRRQRGNRRRQLGIGTRLRSRGPLGVQCGWQGGGSSGGVEEAAAIDHGSLPAGDGTERCTTAAPKPKPRRGGARYSTMYAVNRGWGSAWNGTPRSRKNCSKSSAGETEITHVCGASRTER